MARSNRFAERNAFVEASLENTTALLNIEPVQVRLGAIANKLAHIFEHDIFIPQIRSGEYRFPKDKLPTESVPAFALTYGEHLEIVGASLTPEQIHNISQTELEATKGYSSDSMLQIAQAYAAGTARSKVKNFRIREGTTAFIASREDEIPLVEGKKALILGRPVMGILFEKSKKNISPDVLVHEGTHIVQRIEKPLREIDAENMTDHSPSPASELEAYRIQSLFIAGLKEYGYQPSIDDARQWAYVQEMESIRSRYAVAAEPYSVTRKMRRKLRKTYGSALGIS